MIKWKADLSQVAAFIGTAEGFLDTLETPIYLDDLLKITHAKTSETFNQSAATYAAATKDISHVFEWGTVGINPAPGTAPLNPLNPLSRLWVHQFPGRGGKRSIDFEFRASRVLVPLPNPNTSGLDADFLESKGPQRRHFFYWKAPIMEYGIPVEIKPKYAKALFIPLGGATSADPRASARGYAMTSQAITMVPGEKFAGNFTGFWVAWWTTYGYQEISLLTQKLVDGDADAVVADTQMEARRYVAGVTKKEFSLLVKDARAKARMEAAKRSRARRRAASRSGKQIKSSKTFRKGKT